MSDPASPARVLVVDDEPPIRAIVRGFLEREGMLVAEAADGQGVGIHATAQNGGIR